MNQEQEKTLKEILKDYYSLAQKCETVDEVEKLATAIIERIEKTVFN